MEGKYHVEFVYGGYSIDLLKNGEDIKRFKTDWEIIEVNMEERKGNILIEAYVSESGNFDWEIFVHELEGC